jgi:hypothetical protein
MRAIAFMAYTTGDEPTAFANEQMQWLRQENTAHNAAGV